MCSILCAAGFLAKFLLFRGLEGWMSVKMGGCLCVLFDLFVFFRQSKPVSAFTSHSHRDSNVIMLLISLICVGICRRLIAAV